MYRQQQIDKLIDHLNEAIDLLSCAGPNPLLIESDEYYSRLDSLRDELGVNEQSDEED